MDSKLRRCDLLSLKVRDITQSANQRSGILASKLMTLLKFPNKQRSDSATCAEQERFKFLNFYQISNRHFLIGNFDIAKKSACKTTQPLMTRVTVQAAVPKLVDRTLSHWDG
jgi:hypothetical protein